MLSVLLLALASVSEAHFRLNYAPANLPIRNAPTATADGAWSTDQAGCGGEATWGKNGVTDVRAGDTITISFNYGTGESAPTHPSHPLPLPLLLTLKQNSFFFPFFFLFFSLVAKARRATTATRTTGCASCS